MKRSVIANLVVLAGAVFAYQRLGLAKVPIGVKPRRETPLRPDGTCPPGWTRLGDRCIQL